MIPCSLMEINTVYIIFQDRAKLWHVIILDQMGSKNGTLEIATCNYKVGVPAHCWLHHYFQK